MLCHPITHTNVVTLDTWERKRSPNPQCILIPLIHLTSTWSQPQGGRDITIATNMTIRAQTNTQLVLTDSNIYFIHIFHNIQHTLINSHHHNNHHNRMTTKNAKTT